jgi:superfamily II DNA or RNA helicase
MKALYQHQREILQEDKKKTGLFLGTGSGKTLIALGLARGKTLIICPKTQKEDQNWEREVLKNKIPLNFTVMSKEEFRRDWETLPRFNTVIADEAHTLLGVTPNTRQRNKQIIPKASQLYEALEAFAEKHQPERIYLCTATISKSPMTIWAAAQILGYKDTYGNAWDFYEFRNKFYTKLPMPGREVWAPKKSKEVKDLLASLVHKLGYVGRLEDYFDVPNQVYRTVHVGLNAQQKKRIKEIAIEYPDPIVRVGKTHQVENGVLAGDEFSKPVVFESEKIEKIIEYAEEFPKMIVFAKYTMQILAIERSLKSLGYHVITLNGQTRDKGAAIDEAKNRDEYIFIAQSQVSAGWELPDCPVMIFASKTYSFVDYAQALGRIQRANNIKKNLYIHLVVRDGVDEAVHDCIENKRDFDERVYCNL